MGKENYGLLGTDLMSKVIRELNLEVRELEPGIRVNLAEFRGFSERLKKRGNLMVVISGPSGVGKTSIANSLEEDPGLNKGEEHNLFQRVVTYTSREVRSTEVEGKDYHFISEDRFKEMQEGGEFVEWGEYDGHYYGTGKGDIQEIIKLGKIPVLVLDPEGARKLVEKNAKGELLSNLATFYVFLMPESDIALARRLIGRNRVRDLQGEEKIRAREKARDRWRQAWKDIEGGSIQVSHIILENRTGQDKMAAKSLREFIKKL